MAPGQAGRVRADAGTDVSGSRVRARRREAGFTQASLAEALQVSRQTVISLESGDYSPSVHLALRVARTLGATVEELWG